MIHAALHLLVPLIVALLWYREAMPKAYFLLLVGLLIDVDHLLADPVYDPGRCSIGFHPLHGSIAITVYLAAVLYPRTRIVGIGLLIHIALDAIDCQLIGAG